MAPFQPFAQTNGFYNYFVPHTISLCDSLTVDQVDTASLSSFKCPI